MYVDHMPFFGADVAPQCDTSAGGQNGAHLEGVSGDIHRVTQWQGIEGILVTTIRLWYG